MRGFSNIAAESWAAHAGDAGRRFAVVASEVKNLANQAKTATDQISGQIGMTGIFREIVKGLGDIRSLTETVRQYVSSTAAAFEEQSAVAGEMSASMQRAANEAAEMAR